MSNLMCTLISRRDFRLSFEASPLLYPRCSELSAKPSFFGRHLQSISK